MSGWLPVHIEIIDATPGTRSMLKAFDAATPLLHLDPTRRRGSLARHRRARFLTRRKVGCVDALQQSVYGEAQEDDEAGVAVGTEAGEAVRRITLIECPHLDLEVHGGGCYAEISR